MRELRELWSTLENDRTRGSVELTIHALDSIRSYLEENQDLAPEDCRKLCRRLRETRPGMALMENTSRLMSADLNENDHDPVDTLIGTVENLLDRVRTANQSIADALRQFPGNLETLVLFSRSGTVLTLVRELNELGRVFVLESHPGDEGVSVANELYGSVPDLEFAYDAEAPKYLDQSDALLLGADAFDSEGAVLNKTGSRLLARASGRCPVIACFQTMKLGEFTGESSLPSTTSPDSLETSLRRSHTIFEVVKPTLIDYYATDRGLYEESKDLLNACEDLRESRSDD